MRELRPSTFVVAALLLGAGVSGGLLAGALLATAPGAAEDGAPVGVSRGPAEHDPAGLASAIAELRAAAETLRAAAEQLRAAPRVPDAERADAAHAGEAPDWRALAASIDALAAAVRGMDTGGSAAPLIDPGPVDRRAAVDALDVEGMHQTRDDELYRSTLAKLRSQHLFWTRQRVLDTYGAPDFIGVDEGVLVWQYLLPLEGGGEEELDLRLHDGRVIGLEYSYTPAHGR
jgi:hypothetical protein